MSPYYLVPLVAASVLVAAWICGAIHIRPLNRAEIGTLLDEKRVTQRTFVYGTLLVPLFAIYAAMSNNELANMNHTLRKLFFASFMVSGMIAFVVVTLSGMEVNWNKKLPANANVRKFLFRILLLPLLYGALDIFWLPFAAAWYFLLVAVFQS